MGEYYVFNAILASVYIVLTLVGVSFLFTLLVKGRFPIEMGGEPIYTRRRPLQAALLVVLYLFFTLIFLLSAIHVLHDMLD
jgi:hypothetical protein